MKRLLFFINFQLFKILSIMDLLVCRDVSLLVLTANSNAEKLTRTFTGGELTNKEIIIIPKDIESFGYLIGASENNKNLGYEIRGKNETNTIVYFISRNMR